ncbi:MAG TPA: sigma 54-interacting transcriptional regulator [Candidatus Binatia bacterium]|nr:sigma 54-interacting transcriptional regulator [Candidatus Binatia bacterium]
MPNGAPMTVEDRRRLRLLYELGTAFAAHIDLDELIALVIDKCREVFEAEGTSVLLHDPTTDELYFPYVVSRDAAVTEQLADIRFPADRGFAGEALRSGRAILVNDAQNDPRLYRDVDKRTGTQTRAILTVPLAGKEGPIGVLQVINPLRDGRFTEDDLSFLEALAGSVAIALENARLYATVRASEERLRAEVGVLRRDLARSDRFAEIVGTSDAMGEVFRLMESAAATPITVLIEGETGTGKELIARALHRGSARAEAPFIAVNCAALPESLLESELFGHRRGSFTGALSDRVGLFEAAKGGTIFLDEVGEMPAVMQAKLLRVLQEGEVVPVGDNRPRKVDVRVVSATNRDLAAEVASGRFRQDLYYRLAAFPIRVPPLRERGDDIAPIAARMLDKIAAQYGRKIDGIRRDAVALLAAYSWPGNVRELQNELERATALARPGEAIGPEHLSQRVRDAAQSVTPASAPGGGPPTLGGAAPSALASDGASPPAAASIGASLPEPPSGAPARPGDLRAARASWEAHYIRDALRSMGGNVTRAAQALGLSRVALQKKMKEYGLRET